MTPKAKAVAITAACAGLPFFLHNIWMPFVWRFPRADEVAWVVSLAPALVAALKLGPKAARGGLVAQAIASVVLLRLMAWRVGIHPHAVAPVFLAIGAAVGWFLIPDGAFEGAAPSRSPEPPRSPARPAAAASGPAPASAPSKGRGRMVLRALGGLLLLGAFAGSVVVLYRAFTRVDRELAALEHASSLPDNETIEFLGDHGDDPRVHAWFMKELALVAAGTVWSWEVNSLVPGMERAFAKRKPEDSKEVFDGLIIVAVRDGKDAAKAWLPCPWEDARVTAAIGALLARATGPGTFSIPDSQLGPVFAEVERRHAPPTDELTAAVVRVYVRSNGSIGKAWLDGAAKDPAAGVAIRREFLSEFAKHFVYKAGPDDQKRMDFIASEIEKRCAGLSSDEVLDGFLSNYLNTWPKELDRVVRALGPEAGRRFRERSARETGIAERHATLLLACLAGAGTGDDVPGLIAQTILPPILIEDDFKKLEVQGFPPAIDRTAQEDAFAGTAIRGLIAIGKPAVAQLTSGLNLATRETVRVCAVALASIDPNALVAEVEKKIDLYNRKAPLFEVARDVLVRRDEDAERARAIVREVYPLSEAVAEGLRAIEKIAETDRVNLCFMRGLSCTDQSVAKHCANVLEKRLDKDQFVDTLFRFLAHKESFDVREVDVYEGAVKKIGVAASPSVRRNLERLLDQAGGDPAKVYWIHKVIALRCLVVIGDAAAKPTIEKYAKDPGSYIHIETRTDPKTKKVLSKKETPVPFKDLCEQAIAEIEKR